MERSSPERRFKLTVEVKLRISRLCPLSPDGWQFFFPNVAPGEFKLAITSAGFETQTFSGTLHAGEIETLPQIAMNVADARVEVQVGLTQVEVAEEEIKVEEKQRVLGVIPNFYVSYVPDAVPLNAKQKFNWPSGR